LQAFFFSINLCVKQLYYCIFLSDEIKSHHGETITYVISFTPDGLLLSAILQTGDIGQRLKYTNLDG